MGSKGFNDLTLTTKRMLFENFETVISYVSISDILRADTVLAILSLMEFGDLVTAQVVLKKSLSLYDSRVLQTHPFPMTRPVIHETLSLVGPNRVHGNTAITSQQHIPTDSMSAHIDHDVYLCSCAAFAKTWHDRSRILLEGKCSFLDRMIGNTHMICLEHKHRDDTKHRRGWSVPARRSGWSLGSFQCVGGANDGISCEVSAEQRFTYCPNGACIAGTRSFSGSWIFGIVFSMFVSLAMGVISFAMKLSADHRRRKRQRQAQYAA
eukprot:766442-Hanusia_phi.AAC.2